MYPVHINETGSFQELARSNDVKFGQLSYLIINPLCSRGNHYHKRKEEWFCCLYGSCKMHIFDITTNKKEIFSLDDQRKSFLKIKPFQVHTIKNSDTTKKCELIIINSEEYNEDDSDTFVINELK